VTVLRYVSNYIAHAQLITNLLDRNLDFFNISNAQLHQADFILLLNHIELFNEWLILPLTH